MPHKNQVVIQCAISGASGTGKTQLVKRYINNTSSDESEPTVGASLFFKINNDNTVRLQIWDTSGNSRFESLRTSYYRNSKFILLCCDLTNRASYDELEDFFNEIPNKENKNLVIGLVGTKADLVDKRVISDDQLEKFKTDHNLNFTLTCSAKSGFNVKEIFTKGMKACLGETAPAESSLNTPPKSIPSPDDLRKNYRKNGGGIIATICIFGLFCGNNSSMIIAKMRKRKTCHSGGASDQTLRQFNL